MLRTACRHRDSQESSGDDKIMPYRVRARAPSSGSPAVRMACGIWYISSSLFPPLLLSSSLLFSLLFFSPPPLLHVRTHMVHLRAPQRSGWHVEAHAPGRGMAPFCRHRTIPGCPDAYRRFSARYNPRLMRGGPPRRTEACARRPPRGSIRGLDLRRNIIKTRPFSSTHTPATSHTTQTTDSADSTRSGSG